MGQGRGKVQQKPHAKDATITRPVARNARVTDGPQCLYARGIQAAGEADASGEVAAWVV